MPARRDNLPAAARDSVTGLPVGWDQECDLSIPARVWSAWIPDDGPRGLRRALTDDERAKIESRALALQEALAPYSPAERDGVAAAVAVMLGGFRAMRQQNDDALAVVHSVLYVLRNFPAWAIVAACDAIQQNRAGLDKRFAPNDAEIHDVVAKVTATYRDRLKAVSALFAAVPDGVE